MNEQNKIDFYYSVPYPLDPLTMFVASWEDASITEYLQAHDIEVIEIHKDRFMLVLPEGTQECRRLPVLINEYLRYTLPDGTYIYSAHTRNGVSIAIDRDEYERFKKQ